MRIRTGPLPSSLILVLSGCTGEVAVPVGPQATASDASDASVVEAADANTGVGDEAPSTAGVAIFAQCSGDRETPGPRLLRLLTRNEYLNTVQDLLHIGAPDVASLPLETRVRGYDNNAGSQAVTSRHVDAYLALADTLATQAVREQRAALVHCSTADAACARSFVAEFGLRALRRPLTEDELTRYGALFEPALTQNDFDAGLRLAVTALLVSPGFLYRSEVGEASGTGTYLLSPYEVASALSYLYWGSMPDDMVNRDLARFYELDGAGDAMSAVPSADSGRTHHAGTLCQTYGRCRVQRLSHADRWRGLRLRGVRRCGTASAHGERPARRRQWHPRGSRIAHQCRAAALLGHA